MKSCYFINDIPRKTPPWGMNDLHANTCLVDKNEFRKKKNKCEITHTFAKHCTMGKKMQDSSMITSKAEITYL